MIDVTTNPVLAMQMPSYGSLIAELRECEREIGRLRGRQLRVLRELQRSYRRRVDASSIAAELDVAPVSARAMIETAMRTPEQSWTMANLEEGRWSFDRATAVAGLISAGAGGDTVRSTDDFDIAGIHSLAANVRRVRRRDEQQAFAERHLRTHASLDASVGFIHAQLPALDFELVNHALEERVDQFPPAARKHSREQRRADALVAIAGEWLEGRSSEARRTAGVVTVTVAAETAAANDCETGVNVGSGQRVGPDTLDRIMCEGSVEILIDTDSGRPLAVGPTTRVVPPKVRRLVLSRDGGCTIDGCASRQRLEVHHIVPRSRGGTHDLENLTALCWWHHQVSVHGYGGHIDPDSPPRRRRIIAREPP